MRIMLWVIILLLMPMNFAVAQDAKDQPLDPKMQEESVRKIREWLLTAHEDDLVYGDASDAKLLIFEYASLSCPHCATFHTETLPKLKPLIKSGDVALIFRHYPLNAPALLGAQVVECAEGEDRRKLLSQLFKTQKDWAFSEQFKHGIEAVAKENGMDKEAFDTCLKNDELQQAILTKQLQSNHLQVASTPTFFMNNKKYQGMKTEDFLHEVQQQLSKAKE